MTNQEAIEILKKYKDESEEDYYIKRAEALEKAIETLVNQKIGHWKKISPSGIMECSVCGGNVLTSDIEAYKYCHHCGAEMEGDK